MMARNKQIRPFAWPTAEPEIPTKPAVSPSKDSAPSGADTPLPTAATPVGPGQPHLPAGITSDSTHAFIWHHAEEAAAVVRVLIRGDHFPAPDDTLAGMTPRQLTAAFMAGLGLEVGARVMKHLHREEEARWVGLAVAEERQVSHRVALAVLQAVRVRVETGDYLEDGGLGYAMRLLEGAFHRGRVARLLRPDSESGFGALRDVAPGQIAPYISHEHPQTIALCLSQLKPHMAAGILAHLPQRMQADVAYRMTTMEDISPAALKELHEAMEASLADVLSGNVDVGGPKVVADVLNLSGSSVERNVLDQMDAQDPEVAEAVRNLMFTFADIEKLTDRELQILLKKVDEKDLVIALKASGESLQQKLMGNLSERVRTLVAEELQKLGPMRLSEAEEVQLRIVQQVRQLEEEGKLTIVRGDDDGPWV